MVTAGSDITSHHQTLLLAIIPMINRYCQVLILAFIINQSQMEASAKAAKINQYKSS